MTDLPLLVVHGALIAKLVVALLAAAGLILIMQTRRRRERRRTRNAVVTRSVALTELAPGFASLRGRLHGSACTRTEIEGDTADAAHQHSAPLFVDVDGQRVELIGDVRVVRGTRATAGWRAMPPGTPAELTECFKRGPRRLFSVGDGNEVIVQGVVERRASDAGYREDAATWVMRAALGEPAVELVATRPVSLPVPIGPVVLGLWSMVLLACSYGALHVLGSQLIERGHDEDAAPISMRAQLAAALPGSRHSALRNIGWQLRQAPRSATTFAQTRALIELRDGCAGLADWLLDQEQYEDLVTTARGCVPQDEIRALARLGRYAEAADVIAAHPDVMHDAPSEWVTIEIGASRWTEAATAAELELGRLEHKARSGNTVLADLDRREIAHARCMVAWFRVQAGAPGAAGELSRLAATSDAAACLLADAVQQTGEAHTQGLIAVRAHEHYGDSGRLARALQWLEGSQDELPELPTRFLNYGVDPWIWLAPQIVSQASDSTVRRDGIHLRRAMHAMLAGATSDALAEAKSVAGDGHDAIVAMIALRTPVLSIPWRGQSYSDEDLTREIAVRGGEMSAPRNLAGDCMMGVERALPAAIAGDGGPLAAVISARCDGMTSVIELMFGVVPRVVQHRAELREALRLYSDHPYLHDDLPFRYLEYAAFRRDLLRLAGETGDAARWQARVAGQLAALADHQRTLAFLLWR